MTETKINQLRHCILAYDGIQDTMMLLQFYRPKNIIFVAKIIIDSHITEDEFVLGARQLIEEVKVIKPIEDYPELWI